MAGMNDWSEIEFRLYDEMAGANPAVYNDRFAQALYDTALFNWDVSREDRAAVLHGLRDHLWNEYGIDFDDQFDWEGYRAAYDEATA